MTAPNAKGPGGIGSMATRLLMTALAGAYERQSGQAIAMVAMGGVDVTKRVRAREPFDFAVLAAKVIDNLAAEGHLEPVRVDIARSAMVAAVRAGAKHPEIGSEAQLREAILSGGRIGYSTGPSGDHLIRVLEGWGLRESLAPRLVLAPPGVAVARLLVEDKIDLGFQQMSEFVDEPGIEVVAPLPAPVQLVTVFSAAVCVASGHAAIAREFLAFAASTATDDIKAACGMTPAR